MIDRGKTLGREGSLFYKLLDDPYYFVKFYFLLLFVQSLFFMAPKMQSLINYVFIAWGSLIVAYHFLVLKRYHQDKLLYLFVASWVLGLLTIFINREAGSIVYSLKTWYLLVLVYLIFFPFFMMTKRSIKEIFRGIVLPVVIAQFLAAIASLVLFFANVAGYIVRPDQGFYWGVQYVFRSSGSINPLLNGIYNDPNYATVVIFTSIIFSFALLHLKSTKKGLKVFLWFNIAMQSYFFVLCNSRAANIAILAAMILLVIFIIKERRTFFKGDKPYVISSAILIVLLLVMIVFGGFIRSTSYQLALQKQITRVTIFLPNTLSKQELPRKDMDPDKTNILVIRSFLYGKFVGKYTNYYLDFKPPEIIDSQPFKTNGDNLKNLTPTQLKKIEKSQFDRLSSQKQDSVDSVEGIGNGRIGRWVETVKLVTLHRPLTGTGPRGAVYFSEKYAGPQEGFWRLRDGNSPVNSYLTYLLYFGIPVFLMMMAFFLLQGIKVLKAIFAKGKELTMVQVVMLSFLFFMLISAFFLSALIEVCTFYSCVLAFVFSFCVYGMDKWEEEVR